MKTRFTIIGSSLLLAIFSALGINSLQNIPPKGLSTKTSFEQLWKEVSKLENDDLPKSAIEVVTIIYQKANAEKNYGEFIKSIIYKNKLTAEFEENGLLLAITDVEKEIALAKSPVKEILYSIQGELYFKYFQQNRYKILGRTNLELPDYSLSPEEWTPRQFTTKITELYRKSIEPYELLLKEPIEKYEVLITYGKVDLKTIQPNLYYFLAIRAIDAFSNEMNNLFPNTDTFELNQNELFGTADRFLSLHIIKPKDTESTRYISYFHLKQLYERTKSDRSSSVFFYLEEFRLKKMRQLSNIEDKEQLYFDALKRLVNQNHNSPYLSSLRIELAATAIQMSNRYNSSEHDKAHFDELIHLALQQLDTVILLNQATIYTEKAEYMKAEIQIPSIRFNTEKYINPNVHTPLFFEYRNLTKVKVSISSIAFNDYQHVLESNTYGKERYNMLKIYSKPFGQQEMNLKTWADYRPHSSELILNPMPAGIYIISVEGIGLDGSAVVQNFSVMNVTRMAILKSVDQNTVNILVSDRNTGYPIGNATVKLWKNEYSYASKKYEKSLLYALKTDINGKITQTLTDSRQVYIEAEISGDYYLSEQGLYLNNYNEPESHPQTYIFTDRAIYRPGQTVYFKAIHFTDNTENPKVIAQKELEFTLSDANYQEVATVKAKTNEYGSVTGSFTIPQGRLNGEYRIESSHGSLSFKVEEYKRPRFEVSIDPFKGQYRFNDKVEVIGRATAYAGNFISGSAFKYRVERVAYRYRYWGASSQQKYTVSTGTGVTDSIGQFKFEFVAEAESDKTKADDTYFYKIYVDVIDISGESQSTEDQITVGQTAINLWASIPSELQLSQIDSFLVGARNLDGQNVESELNWELFRVETPKVALKNARFWELPSTPLVDEAEWNSKLPNYWYQTQPIEKLKDQLVAKEQITKSDITFWKPQKSWLTTGTYRLVLHSKDAFGRAIQHEEYFDVVDYQSKQIKSNQTIKLKAIKASLEQGNDLELLVGTAFDKAFIVLEIAYPNGTKDQQNIKLSNEQKIIRMPLSDKGFGNIQIQATILKNGRIYTTSEHVSLREPNRSLDVKFMTFRNKLYPGQKETWTVTIKGEKGEKAAAEFLAGMYDASLDAFHQQDWYLYARKPYQHISLYSSSDFTLAYDNYVSQVQNNKRYSNISEPELNWFGFNMYSTNRMYKTAGRARGDFKSLEVEEESGAIPSPTTTAYTQSLIAEDALSGKESAKKLDDSSIEQDGQTKNTDKNNGLKQPTEQRIVVKPRKNFNETAFFYPQLSTDAEGNVSFSFTMPESLTEWKFRGLAHTKNLVTGLINETIQTQKDLMVMPNVPRFFREGDRAQFKVKVVNLSDKALEASTMVRFYDASTMKEITSEISSQLQAVKTKLAKGESKIVELTINVPFDYQAITYRIVSSAGQFADAEEQAIPVLSNRMLVTESLPLPMNGPGSKNFEFERFNNIQSSTLKHFSYTLEMSSNPAWYAVQALPYLTDYPYECAEQTFSRFYAHALAAHIANSNPKIKAIFEQWQNTPNSEALLSNLDKNQELKSLLLQETPWVLESQNEGERKRRLALLFDVNNLAAQQEQTLKKLLDMQSESGAWSWFEGMPDNRYITQLIITGMGRLKFLNVLKPDENAALNSAINKAMQYMDRELAKDYKQLKSHYDDKQLSQRLFTGTTEIQYLYGRSFFDASYKVLPEAIPAIKYYQSNATQYWSNLSPYMQAMFSLSLIRSKEDKNYPIATKVLAALKEHSLHSEEMGMYWKSEDSYYWYQAPIERQAMFIEFFDAIGGENQNINDMRLWLLKQKQTQNWPSTRSTTDAIYALLLKGTDFLSTEQNVKVFFDQKLINPKDFDVRPEQGTGHFKVNWKGDAIEKDFGHIRVEKTGDGPAWGAVYWQYFEDLDKITASQNALQIQKKIFVIEQTKSGANLVALDSKPIKIGDKIRIQLTLKVDRDMEYVHLKDLRASGLEPVDVISSYRWNNGLGYYQSTKDASTNFFFESLHKGTYVFEYELKANMEGEFSNGITSIQCMYAPEFTSHSQGQRITIQSN